MTQSFEPERLYCTAGECVEEAVVAGLATWRVNPLAGAPDHELLQTFTLPMCTYHASLLRANSTLVEFHSGLADRHTARGA